MTRVRMVDGAGKVIDSNDDPDLLWVYPRLQALKKRYDSENLIRHSQSVLPID
ncbi:BBE domain-containing protein [Akkermansiaceae bacterium]|nr:BBE domain-containing protein [Akkermansiaceae bacterium]